MHWMEHWMEYTHSLEICISIIVEAVVKSNHNIREDNRPCSENCEI